MKDVLRLKLDAQPSHRQTPVALSMSKAAVTKYRALAVAAGLDWALSGGLMKWRWSGACTRNCAAGHDAMPRWEQHRFAVEPLLTRLNDKLFQRLPAIRASSFVKMDTIAASS